MSQLISKSHAHHLIQLVSTEVKLSLMLLVNVKFIHQNLAFHLKLLKPIKVTQKFV